MLGMLTGSTSHAMKNFTQGAPKIEKIQNIQWNNFSVAQLQA
jgi:hypothetical protein